MDTPNITERVPKDSKELDKDFTKSAEIMRRLADAASSDLNNRIAGFLEARYGNVPKPDVNVRKSLELYQDFFKKNQLTLRNTSTNGFDHLYTLREKGRKVFELSLTVGFGAADSNRVTMSVKTEFSILRRGMKALKKGKL